MPEEAPAPPVLPWNWERRDAGEIAESWTALAPWVRWFVVRYHLVGRVPACWFRHPGLVDELRALRECLAKGHHVEDRAHGEDAARLGEDMDTKLLQAIENGELAPRTRST